MEKLGNTEAELKKELLIKKVFIFVLNIYIRSSKLINKLLEGKVLFSFPYYEAQKSPEVFLPQNKMMETSKSTQIHSYFDYFKLRMETCIIS